MARELGVVLPVSFFERAGQAYFNSVAIIDADGSVLGIYRKAHIPNGPGYQEKTYFSPGDTGFRVWDTRFGRIGVGICWDQWFPECARVMALLGAELLLYPTAIGSEPPPALPVHSRDHWQRTQQGHAAANLMPLIASNRYRRGAIAAGSGRPVHPFLRLVVHCRCHRARRWPRRAKTSEAVLLAEFDLAQLAEQRDNWFVFRDRRPELYAPLLTLDGDRRRQSGVRILFVCLGNICRSPTVRRGTGTGAARSAASGAAVRFGRHGGLPHGRST